MKIKLIALAIMASAISGIADAQMSNGQQFIVQNYLSTHPELPLYQTQEIQRKATLQEVIDYVKGNSYYNGSTTVSLPPIDTTAIPVSTLTPATKPQAAILTDDEGEALTQANQQRTAQQTEALQDSSRQHLAQLEGEALTQANQQRTAQQDEALQDSYRQHLAQLKGEALTKANQERTAQQDEALQDSYRQRFAQLKGEALTKANQERTAQQDEALQDSYRQRFAQLKGEALTQANQERTEQQDQALQDSYRQHLAQLKGEALTKANQERTAQQTEALEDSYRQHLAQLKGEALTKANQERTEQQTEALQDAYRTASQKVDDEKGQALFESNLKRTQMQSDALNAAKSEHEVNPNQVDAAQYRTMVNAQVAESSHEELVQQTDANTDDINTLNAGLKQAQAMGSSAQSRANDAYANAEANRQALQATNHRVADNSAAIADHEQRIETLESSNSANFGKLKKQVDDNRQRASAAISGVAAMANIPQVIQGQTFSVGAGVGTTDSESALAVGFSARAAEHVVVKASVSDDTQQNFVVGGGVSYGW